MSFIQERERRANAGSRMRALLNQEIDMEELFEYNEAEEDQEFSTQGEEEEDKIDSDFDLDSSEGEQENIEEGQAMDKELILQEKRARRVATTFNPVIKPPVERRKRVTKRSSETSTTDKRHSSRKNTVLNRLAVEDQIREHEKRRALLPKRDKKIIKKLTQEELLAEAALTEEKNKSSLLEWQQKEAERKESAKHKEKRGIAGPLVRYHSFADEYGTQLMGRNLITFVDKKTNNENLNLELAGLIQQLEDWRKKILKPNKPILCPITGQVAKYRDPDTNVPYATIEAYKTIKACLKHQMKWSSTHGIYLGHLPSAKGVPDGWNK